MTDEFRLTFHGAAETVTGSCMEIAHGKNRILVDCGLFQGSRSLEKLNRGPFYFQPSSIDAVVLTHAHIDHSGLLPRLAAQGFSGRIWCTLPTRDLLHYMLADSARLQEADTERRNRRADRADEPPIEPLYTLADAELALGLIHSVPLDEWFEIAPGLQGRLWNAGHILGSSSLELSTGKMSVLFSGDLGPRQKTLQLPAEAPGSPDYVICEATYGDRERTDTTIEERLDLLGSEVRAALDRGGNLIIPAFAVERTQELLLDIATLFDRHMVEPRPIFIDSPLASRATEVFSKHAPPGSEDGAIFRNSVFHYVESAQESIRLNNMSGAIILAGSGMCEGGRVRHHLVHNLPRRDSTVLFVGFQAQGTLGRTILEGAQRVRISGRDLAVRATIRKIDSYSAHADRADLIRWIDDRRPVNGSIFLSHGEKEALNSLKEAIDGPTKVLIPTIGETYLLRPGQPASREKTGRADVAAVVAGDWQNDYAALAVNLKRDLQRIHDDAARQEAVVRMRQILEEYTKVRSKRRHEDRSQARHRAHAG